MEAIRRDRVKSSRSLRMASVDAHPGLYLVKLNGYSAGACLEDMDEDIRLLQIEEPGRWIVKLHRDM